MKAYITESNSRRIVFKLNLRDIDINEEIFRIEFKWFSDYEIKGLLAFKLLFEKPEEFFKRYEQKKASDTKRYIYEGQSPAHHMNPDCERILSSFHNYKLPDEIRLKGEDAIHEFRHWFAENRHLMEEKMDLFLDKLKWKFGLKERPEVVDYKNSGVQRIENINLEELEDDIENKIKEANSFYASSGKNKTILNNFGKISFIYKEKKEPYQNKTNYSVTEIWDVLKEFDEEYKTPITFLLREYYKVKYNPKLEFDGSLLEQLGFEPCRHCCDPDYLQEYDSRGLAPSLLRTIINKNAAEEDNLPF